MRTFINWNVISGKAHCMDDGPNMGSPFIAGCLYLVWVSLYE